MKRLRIATTNPGKLRELRQMLAPLGYEVWDVSDLPGLHIVEDGATFADNAIKKAQTVLAMTGDVTLADDSGLEVDALNGDPGVYSARYAGVDGPDQDTANRRKLLAALRDVPEAERTARFVCVLAWCAPGAAPQTFGGTLEGTIACDERGTNGFGYDPIFVVPAFAKTLAELPSETKNAISHRGQALRALWAALAPGR